MGVAAIQHAQRLGSVLFAMVALSPTAAGSGDLRVPAFAPRISDSPHPEPPGPIEVLRQAGRLTPRVRIETYDERLRPHPVIEEAAALLVEGLAPYAEGVYLTSLSRAPDEQRELMRSRPYRFWAIERSKHLMGGFAADIGFVGRRASMAKIRDAAEAMLHERMGTEKARLLRVVAEARCIHIEIDSRTGREDIEARANAMHRWGIVKSPPDGENPVPHIKDYVPEEHWTKRPRHPLLPAPG